MHFGSDGDNNILETREWVNSRTNIQFIFFFKWHKTEKYCHRT